MTPILAVEKLTKTYTSGDKRLTVLNGVSFQLDPGGSCAIVGPSGSGKTTLLALCAGLDTPSSGTVRVNGQDLGGLEEDDRARLRSDLVGFVFQNFQLLPTLTALENVMVPLELRGGKKARDTAMALLEQVGLGKRLNHYPAQLSGGEQQRVSIARAFINQPRLLFADEPTGNLDYESSEAVVKLLFDLNRSAGTALLLVTHNLELATRAGRVISLRGGELIKDEVVEPETP